jgi:hypothetical protein
MSVDLVTIVATHAPDLHPSGASKIFHHAGDKPDLDHYVICITHTHTHTKDPFFAFLLHCMNSLMLLTEATH